MQSACPIAGSTSGGVLEHCGAWYSLIKLRAISSLLEWNAGAQWSSTSVVWVCGAFWPFWGQQLVLVHPEHLGSAHELFDAV